jgi:hypothetical protein
MVFVPRTKRAESVADTIIAGESGDIPKQSIAAKESLESYLKTLLKSKDPEKKEFLRGKSIIYK